MVQEAEASGLATAVNTVLRQALRQAQESPQDERGWSNRRKSFVVSLSNHEVAGKRNEQILLLYPQMLRRFVLYWSYG